MPSSRESPGVILFIDALSVDQIASEPLIEVIISPLIRPFFLTSDSFEITSKALCETLLTSG